MKAAAAFSLGLHIEAQGRTWRTFTVEVPVESKEEDNFVTVDKNRVAREINAAREEAFDAGYAAGKKALSGCGCKEGEMSPVEVELARERIKANRYATTGFIVVGALMFAAAIVAHYFVDSYDPVPN